METTLTITADQSVESGWLVSPGYSVSLTKRIIIIFKMKLDASVLRYLEREDMKILSALEQGSRNHEVVPLSLVASICRMRPGGVNARIFELSKHKLVSKEHQSGYEGFRLTYGGYDYLALNTLAQRNSVLGVGRQIGVGKEADVYLVRGCFPEKEGDKDGEQAPEGEHDFVLKIERLGRTSFRTVKTNRDYQGGRKHLSWWYLSRLAAEKEWNFMQALWQHGFPTPHPVDWSRHCVVMESIVGKPLEQLHKEDWPEESSHLIAAHLFNLLMHWLVRLAEEGGLVHGDYNEFNIIVREAYLDDPEPFLALEQADWTRDNCPVTIIDFPQMVSIHHANAAEFFDRDVSCLRLFFERRFHYIPCEWPQFEREINKESTLGLDRLLRASGYKGKSSFSALKDSVSEEDRRSEDNTENSSEDNSEE